MRPNWSCRSCLPPAALQATPTLTRACDVLAAWDRRADLDSRGAVLFREFWNLAAAIRDKWAVPFNPADPVNTPRGLTPSASAGHARRAEGAVQKLQALEIPLDGRLGDYQDETRNGVRVPSWRDRRHRRLLQLDPHGHAARCRTGYHDVEWGTSYVQAVTFDDAGPVAHGMLVYGQSVDPASPHYADQVPLYTAKSWPLLPFHPNEVRRDPITNASGSANKAGFNGPRGSRARSRRP